MAEQSSPIQPRVILESQQNLIHYYFPPQEIVELEQRVGGEHFQADKQKSIDRVISNLSEAVVGNRVDGTLLVLAQQIQPVGTEQALILMASEIGNEIRVWRSGTEEYEIFREFYDTCTPFVLEGRVFSLQVVARANDATTEEGLPSFEDVVRVYSAWDPDSEIEKRIVGFFGLYGYNNDFEVITKLLDPQSDIPTYSISEGRCVGGVTAASEGRKSAFFKRDDAEETLNSEASARSSTSGSGLGVERDVLPALSSGTPAKGRGQEGANTEQEKKAAKRSPSQQSMRSIVPSAALGLVASLVVVALLNRVRIQKMIQTWRGSAPKVDLPLPPIEVLSSGEGILS